MRRAVLAFAIVAVAGVAGLIATAAGDTRSEAFSLNVQTAQTLAPIYPHRSGCQGPIGAQSPFSGLVAYFGTSGPPGAAIDVTVRDATGGDVLARGGIPAGWSGLTTFHVHLDHAIRLGRNVTVCFRSRGPALVALLGSRTAYPATALVVAGKRTHTQAELIFLRPHPPSLWSLLPTVFRRAALFRPSWVGVWTFWVLSAGLLAAFVLGGAAVGRAAQDEA